jgi:CDP-diacylglycerol--serine O-phosphatidyltransferase
MRNSARFVPSLFTILNLFSGFLSIINAANHNMEQACLFVIYASLFDALDGVAARFTRTTSKFGVELDSLSDLVSFGAAPSFILYRFYFYRLDGIGIALASLIMLFGAIRLARFNARLVGFDKNYFSGVPIPISALTVVSFFLFYYGKSFSAQMGEIFIYGMVFLLPVLMVSKFKYDTLPRFTLREIKSHPVKFIFIFLIMVVIVITRGEGLFAFCLFYLSTGVFRGVTSFARKKLRASSKPREGKEEEYTYKTTN